MDMSGEPAHYLKIRLQSLHASVPIPFDIFVLINNRYVHYLKSGDSLSPEKIAEFEQKAPESFFVDMKDRQNYKNYLHGRLTSSQLSPFEKAKILREGSLALVEEIFETPDVQRALGESKQLIEDFVSFMDAEPEALGHLIGLSSHDFYTYNHSLDVSVYSLGLASVAGFKDQDLVVMGQGALFHDIGKKFVPVEIITKDGPLDDVEWASMKRHPEFGLKVLMDHNATEEIKACCFEHHESAAGNGYPQGLTADEIHPMARIVAITDTYDALTTKRSYNVPMSPRDALSFMREKLSGRYDSALLKAMLDVLFQMDQAQKKLA